MENYVNTRPGRNYHNLLPFDCLQRAPWISQLTDLSTAAAAAIMAICQNVALSTGHGNRDRLDLWICEKIIHLSKAKKGKNPPSNLARTSTPPAQLSKSESRASSTESRDELFSLMIARDRERTKTKKNKRQKINPHKRRRRTKGARIEGGRDSFFYN